MASALIWKQQNCSRVSLQILLQQIRRLCVCVCVGGGHRFLLHMFKEAELKGKYLPSQFRYNLKIRGT